MKFNLKDEMETITLGEQIGKQLKKGDSITFFGGMGAGKTTFTRGILQGLGEINCVSSPTYNIVHTYHTKLCPVHHFDLYKINTEDDLYTIGYFDYLEEEAILIFEWSEKGGENLPLDGIKIEIIPNGTGRTVSISGEKTKNWSINWQE